MKKLLITSVLLLLALISYARDINVNTKSITRFEVITNNAKSRYFIVVGNFKYELHTKQQQIAISKLAYTNKVIKISVK